MSDANPNLKNLLRTEPAAALVGVTKSTFYDLVERGIAPPPAVRIGTVCFWSKDDLNFFVSTYEGRPARRKSAKKG